MTSVSDGWEAHYDDQTYVNAYDQLEMALLEPVDRILEKADVDEFRPKFKAHKNPKENSGKHENEEKDDDLVPIDLKNRKNRKNRKKQKKNGDEEWRDAIYHDLFPEESEESDHEQRKSYFQPPLQVQRNSFVKNTLMKFKRETQNIERLGVMGCGEMSLERGISEYLGAFGTTNVLSVDIDPVSLSVGQQLLQKHLCQHEELLGTETGLPVLMRSFLGNILEPDHRFADLDAIVSMEVVEHIPLSDAKLFVNNVLGVLLPRIFIFSTPNHEYNTVFGMSPGEFRHDDHKFEMSRKEFSDWLDELSVRFPYYRIDPPNFIGMTRGFEELQGASQAAVCRLQDDLNTNLPLEITPYELVGSVACRLGSRQVAFNLVRQAFLEWLEKTELRESELIKTDFLNYWIFNVKQVLHHIHAPISFASTIDEKVAIKYIQGMTSHQVSSEFSHGFNGIAIVHFTRKEQIIEAIRKNSQ